MRRRASETRGPSLEPRRPSGQRLEILENPSMAELKAGIASVLGLVPDWVVAVAVLSLVVIFGLIVQDLAVRLLSRRLGRWRPLWRALFVRTQGVVRFALVVLAIRITTALGPMGAETAAIERLHRPRPFDVRPHRRE